MSTIEEELAELRRERDAYRRRIGELEAKLEETDPLARLVADLRVQLHDSQAAVGQVVIHQSSRVAELEADLDEARRALADRKLGTWVRLSDRLVVNLAAYEAIIFKQSEVMGSRAILCPITNIPERTIKAPGELEALRRVAARMVSP